MMLKIEETTLQTIKNQAVWKKYYWLEKVSIALLIIITYVKYSKHIKNLFKNSKVSGKTRVKFNGLIKLSETFCQTLRIMFYTYLLRSY